jgi:TonB family protein
LTQREELFASCILFREVFADELGRLFRAGVIEGNAVERVVWLRILDGPGLPKPAIVETFEVARRIGERVTSAQLVSNPFFFESAGIPALGFDHVAGQSLNRVLIRSRDEAFPLQPDNSLLITERIAQALGAFEGVEVEGKAFAHGFLHPALIHLTNDGDARLAGAGIGPGLLRCLENDVAIPAGRAYLAPEILAGGDPTPGADLYSLGAILFHLLTATALPPDPEDRGAALTAAHLAWDGEPLPEDIRSILTGALAVRPADRFQSAAEFRAELDSLLYGGAYSPTTFNLALFMDRLFRAEIEADELAMTEEQAVDPTQLLVSDEEPEASPAIDVDAEPPPAAVPPDGPKSRPRTGLWVAIAAVVLLGSGAGLFWILRSNGAFQGPPPTPTPEEIAARRQAQEDRLRTLTQEMVQQMMAEREEEIREELMARQTRIEELQRRLQQSEQRAAKSAAAAAQEAETQKALIREIEEQEQAQRAQQDALEAERQEALDDATAQAALVAEVGEGELETDPSEMTATTVVADEEPTPGATPTLEPISLEPTVTPMVPSVAFGDFVPPDELDAGPVVVKSQPLEWPRSAARSKGKGVVVIQLTVNAEGGIDKVEVLRSDHSGWGIPEAAMEAAAAYRYKPGTKDGVPVTTFAFVTWRYDFTGE